MEFNKKVDDDHIKNVLNTVGAKPDLKKISKEIVTGKECLMTCHHYSSSESHFGRSTVLDLNAPHGKNFRQVDHRTLNSLILKNVKYTVK